MVQATVKVPSEVKKTYWCQWKHFDFILQNELAFTPVK